MPEQPHTLHQFSYHCPDGSCIKIDAWYHTWQGNSDGKITVNILHVDKNSAVSQIFREDIPSFGIANTRSDVEKRVTYIARESIAATLSVIPNGEELEVGKGKEISVNSFGRGSMTFYLIVSDIDDNNWKIEATAGVYTEFLNWIPLMTLFAYALSKKEFPTKESAQLELNTRFRIDALAALLELEHNDILSRSIGQSGGMADTTVLKTVEGNLHTGSTPVFDTTGR